MAYGVKTGGRAKGSVNKATLEARQAIAAFVDDNAHRLQEWLDEIADGVKHPGKEGEYLTLPNPEKAFDMFQKLVEYHIPKLGRTIVSGDADNPLIISEIRRTIVDTKSTDTTGS